jgi:membrane associated rhomboid family serine protease
VIKIVEDESLESTRKQVLDNFKFPAATVVVIWFFYIIQWFTLSDWGEMGIYPRKIWGLSGIITSPLIHGSWAHLMSNSAPLFVLTAITVVFYKKIAMRAFWMIYWLTGLSVWLLARPVYHIGASGVIYGLVSFIFWNGIFRQSMRSIFLALIVMVFYSGMFVGILPDQEGVSWESHLLGSIVGIFVSFWYKGELEEDEVAQHNPFEDEVLMEKTFFLPQNAFEMTKEERIFKAAEAQRLAILEAERQIELRRLAALEAFEAQKLENEKNQNIDNNQPPFWTQTWTGI